MKRGALAQRMARSTNESYEFQFKWKQYITRFGPIIEEAFINDDRAKIQLVNILDEMDVASELVLSYKIDKLIDYCYCDRDYLVYYFVLGLFYERLNMLYEALNIYKNILMYEQNHYYLFLRIADIYYELQIYPEAMKYYLFVVKKDFNLIDSTKEKICKCKNKMDNDIFH